MRPASPWTRALLAAGVLLLVVLRVPFLAQQPFEVDVGNFMLAVADFDVAQHRPHPPGYFLYVMIVRMLAAVTGDAHAALVWFAAAASALAAVPTWLLARQFLDRQGARWVVALCLFNPASWFYSCVGLASITELLWTPWVLWLLVAGARGERKSLLWGSLLLGLAGGFRQNLLVFLAPCWFFAVWHCPGSWRHRGAATALLLGGVSCWFVPTVIDTGGLAAYRAANAFLADSMAQSCVFLSPVAGEVAANLVRFASSAVVALGLAGLLGLGLAVLRWRRLPWQRDGASLLAVAVAAPLLFFVAVYFHKKAYVLVLLAPASIMAVAGLRTLRRPVWAPAVLLLTLAVHQLVFFTLPPVGQVAARGDGFLVPHENLPAVPRLGRHLLMLDLATLRDQDRRTACVRAAVDAALVLHPDLVLVVPEGELITARVADALWPRTAVWTFAGGDDGEVARLLHGDTVMLPRGELQRTLAAVPSLWVLEANPELAGRLQQLGAARLEAAVPMLLRPPGP